MTSTPARVQAGVPAGGQFATTDKAEADVSLDALTDAFLDAHANDDLAEVEQTIAHAYDSARHWQSRKDVRERSRGLLDVDDIAQEAMLTVLERQANGHVIEDAKGYMHSAAWGVAQQAGNGAVRQENRKALAMHTRAVSERSAALGRDLTEAEKQALADEIRENWHDPRRKPSKDFRRFAGRMETSMDALSPESAVYLLPNSTLGQPGADTREVAPGSYTDRALSAVEGHDGTVRDARRMLWNALAEAGAGDVPMVTPGTLSQRRCTTARSQVLDRPGGVPAALQAWREGALDADTTEALFAPWGPDADRKAVADQMSTHAEHATDLWSSALQLSNNRNSDRS